MDFTREPIIETIISPREGCKLVVRSSKSVGQEEFFVDAVEVVSFGSSFFFRSLEKPKPFLVPASDYEVLEVREARIMLKQASAEKSVKQPPAKEPSLEAKQEPKEQVDRKRDKRRSSRRGKTKTEKPKQDAEPTEEKGEELPAEYTEEKPKKASLTAATNFLSSLLTPPTQLISDKMSKAPQPSAEAEQEEVHFQRIQDPEPPQKD
ncbi:MAG: hypothetical protein KDK65_01235 [Chlamydiia bacterium]|nr:hypothetical protein [Chlamydiia bacterium]